MAYIPASDLAANRSIDWLLLGIASLGFLILLIFNSIVMMTYNRKLSEAAQEANQANEAKSAFLSTMSHDIRTPMNAILGLNEMILRDSEDDGIRMYSENIRTAGNTLLGIINDILDFSKIEAGKMEIINVDYSSASLLNDLVNMVQKKAEDLDKLFVAFERIEEKRNRNIEGTGLGMTIVQRFLGMMGSHLEVTSEYGKGSVFSFDLEQKVVKWDAIGDFEETYRRSLSERINYREKFTAPDARVLVVDDTPVNLTVFASLLKRTGLKIDTADSDETEECVLPEFLRDIKELDTDSGLNYSGELMRPSLERLYEFVNSDCIDVAKCQEEITDEYDQVIMRFFEGDVPMMFANGDVVSGTAKREQV